MMKIALTVLVIITANPLSGGTLPQTAKVLFPNQDDQNEYTGFWKRVRSTAPSF